jgi:hypothetical protein
MTDLRREEEKLKKETKSPAIADPWLEEEEDVDEVSDKMIRDSWYGTGDGKANTGSTKASGTATGSSSLSAKKPLTTADLRRQEKNDPNQKPAQPKSTSSGGTRTLDNVYADLDAANKSYDEYTDKLSSTDPNVLRAAQYYSGKYGNEIKDLKKEEKSLLDQARGHEMTAGESFAYGAERAGAGLLGMGEAVTDFIGGGMNRAAQGVTSLFGSKPNMVSDWFGEGAQKFEENSISRDYEQSIDNRYLPTATSRISRSSGRRR